MFMFKDHHKYLNTGGWPNKRVEFNGQSARGKAHCGLGSKKTGRNNTEEEAHHHSQVCSPVPAPSWEEGVVVARPAGGKCGGGGPDPLMLLRKTRRNERSNHRWLLGDVRSHGRWRWASQQRKGWKTSHPQPFRGPC